jgi:hypothetical protein
LRIFWALLLNNKLGDFVDDVEDEDNKFVLKFVWAIATAPLQPATTKAMIDIRRNNIFYPFNLLVISF